MIKTIELPIEQGGVNTAEMDKLIAEGWKIVAVTPEAIDFKVRVRMEKEDA